MFQDADYETLQIISCLKATGMSLKGIREFISFVQQGDSTIDQRLALFQTRKEEVEKQMAELQRTLETIEFKCWFYQTAREAGTTEVPEKMPAEDLPEKFRSIRARLRKCETPNAS